jgi:hypothetical protein
MGKDFSNYVKPPDLFELRQRKVEQDIIDELTKEIEFITREDKPEEDDNYFLDYPRHDLTDQELDRLAELLFGNHLEEE